MDPEDDGPPVDPDIGKKLVKPDDFKGLSKLLASLWSDAMVDSYGLVSDHVGETVDPSKDTPARKRLMKLAAQQVTAIDETTRARVAAYVERAVNDGMSPKGLAKLIASDPSGVFSASRATTIARTETAMAYAHGSVAGWRDSGRVERVIIFDGDDTDGPCMAANGSVWTLEEYEANPIEHPNCFIGSTMVLAPNSTAAFARQFDGEVVVLRTADDDLLTCTPNHPILTRRGWVAAGDIHLGDQVFRCLDAQGVASLVNPDYREVPARIEDVAGALIEAGHGAPTTMPAAAVALNGPSIGRDVHVIRADGFGERDGEPLGDEHLPKIPVVLTDVGLVALASGGMAALLFEGDAPATGGIMGGGSTGSPPRWADGGQVHGQGLALSPHSQPGATECDSDGAAGSPNRSANGITGFPGDVPRVEGIEIQAHQGRFALSHSNTTGSEDAPNTGGAYPQVSPDLVGCFSGLVAATNVVSVERRQWSGHVYNLETVQRWYIADNIIAHNCVRSAAPYLDD